MVGSKFHRNRFSNSKRAFPLRMVLSREKNLIETNYNFLNCKLYNGKLICKGINKPTKHSKVFEFEIIYDGISSPKIFVTNPVINYNDDIHVYPDDNSLCLFHKSDLKWDYRKHHLFNTIIPWTIEWFIFYELYLISGKWEHPFVPHKRLKE